MPSSLRLLIVFVVVSVLAAIASIVTLKWENRDQGRMIAEQITGGSVTAGEAAYRRYGCGGCHEINSIAGTSGQVGPSLAKIATRSEIAGHFANTPQNMTQWLQHPQQMLPGNGMPDMGVTDRDARDIAAYLYTKR
jgi:cytochrome c2